MSWPPRFCCQCGASLGRIRPDRNQTRCPACGSVQYRNAKPCAGVLIERSGCVLLARRGIEPRLGAWDIVGGFLHPDETPEAAARREALEETGLQIVVRELLGMFIDRYGDGLGADYTLNIYYRAQPVGGQPSARSDAAELRWFPVEQLPESMAFPHEVEVLARWKALARIE